MMTELYDLKHHGQERGIGVRPIEMQELKSPPPTVNEQVEETKAVHRPNNRNNLG